MSKILELRRERAATLAKAKHLQDIVDGEKRAMSEQESKDFDSFMGEAENLGNEIKRREALDAALPPEQRDGADKTPKPSPQIGMQGADLRNYSVVRAIRAMTAAQRGERNAWKGAELELEASEAVHKRFGVEPRGFFVPADVLEQRSLEQRDLNVGTATAGGNLVATDLLASSFIELLRNRVIVRQAGATMLTGLVGNVDIPKQTGGATAYWVGEGSSPTESQQTIGQVELSPKTLGAYTDFTRRLLVQSSRDVEMFVRNDLMTVLGLAVDYAALHGDSGSDPNQPDGIENITGVGAPGVGAWTWAAIVGLETEVASANADMGALTYVTNAAVRGKLKTTAKVGSSDSVMIWDSQSNATPVNGYRTLVSNQVRATGGGGGNESFMFFGNWADLLIGMWSGIDILVDPYTHSTSGTVRIVALQDIDIDARHAESFAFEQATA
ncbi:MAG TPA: phage major capsid protein [Caldilineaceae bacterium]|nr:phage major capsid protein [Caldilineaceae bacterium]